MQPFSFQLLITHYRWVLPCLSACLLILALPPITWSWLVLVALVPLYVFTARAERVAEVVLGYVAFGFIFSGYITYVVLAGFTWLEAARLFVWLVYGFGVAVVVIATAVSMVWGYMLYRGWQRYPKSLVRLLTFTSFVLTEALLSVVLFNFNYGELASLAAAFPLLLALSAWGSTLLASAWIVFGNALLGELLIAQKRSVQVPVFLVSAGMLAVLVWYEPPSLPAVGETVSVAIIQDATRDEREAFGVMRDGQFTFPLLEGYVAEIAAQDTPAEFIIYPFNPWSGVLGARADNQRFDREVIAVDTEAFTAWLRAYVPAESIFVTWYTVYEAGAFYNEIGYWQNGERIAYHRKQKLFPFFDYTPAWAQQYGIYSTPIDGAVGDSSVPTIVSGVPFGNLVCSEILDDAQVARIAAKSAVMMSIGSEAMFTHEIPSAYNYYQAQIHAVRQQQPLIRANRFGPSAVFAADGSVLATMPYGTSGVLYAAVPVATVSQ